MDDRQFHTIPDLDDLLPNYKKIKARDSMERLGLVADDAVNGPSKVPTFKRDQILQNFYDKTKMKVAEVAKTKTIEELDNDLRRVETRKYLTEDLLEDFGERIWGKTRTHVRKELSELYSTQLDIRKESGKNRLEIYLCCWIAKRVFDKKAKKNIHEANTTELEAQIGADNPDAKKFRGKRNKSNAKVFEMSPEPNQADPSSNQTEQNDIISEPGASAKPLTSPTSLVIQGIDSNVLARSPSYTPRTSRNTNYRPPVGSPSAERCEKQFIPPDLDDSGDYVPSSSYSRSTKRKREISHKAIRKSARVEDADEPLASSSREIDDLNTWGLDPIPSSPDSIAPLPVLDQEDHNEERDLRSPTIIARPMHTPATDRYWNIQHSLPLTPVSSKKPEVRPLQEPHNQNGSPSPYTAESLHGRLEKEACFESDLKLWRADLMVTLLCLSKNEENSEIDCRALSRILSNLREHGFERVKDYDAESIHVLDKFKNTVSSIAAFQERSGYMGSPYKWMDYLQGLGTTNDRISAMSAIARFRRDTAGEVLLIEEQDVGYLSAKLSPILIGISGMEDFIPNEDLTLMLIEFTSKLVAWYK